MHTKLFHRLSYLLLLFQNPCFAALQTASSNSTNVDNVSNKNDVICTIHSEVSKIEPKNLGNELLVCGYMRQFEAKVTNKIIPNCIIGLCVYFSRRLLPCDCIKEKYRKILPKLDMDENRKRAIIFCLTYKEIVNVQDNKLKRTIFHFACKKGYLELAKLLEKLGANIHVKDKWDNNALHFACYDSGSVEMVTWLLDVCKMEINEKGRYQRTPFLCAAQKGDLAIAKQLEERGADISAMDSHKNNALHEACLFSKSEAMVTWLLDHCKINLESKKEAEATPFLCAAQEGSLKIAALLKEQGADIHAKDESGNNALHLACLYSDSKAMVTWLLDECKIDIESKGEFETTPLLCAAQGGSLDIVNTLIKKGANIKATDEDGYNALWWANRRSDSNQLIYRLQTYLL